MNVCVDQLLDIADAISRGEVPEYQHNECFTSGAFDLLLINANEAKSFELLTDVCRRFESVEAAGNNMKGYYLLVSTLAQQTKTTEMPPGMTALIDAHPELSHDIKQWYRYQG